MIKLAKKDLQKLEDACELLSKLYMSSTTEERNSLNIACAVLVVDGILLHYSNMEKEGR